MDSEYIIRLAKIYARHQGYTIATVSTYWSGSGDALMRLIRGKNITIKRYNSITQTASDQWPTDLNWPHDIPRPAPAPDSIAAKNLNKNANDSENPAHKLDSNGHIANPKAFCKSLIRPFNFSPETHKAMLDNYYQVVRKYGDEGEKQHLTPRKNTNAWRILNTLIKAGDTRFAERIATKQRVAALMGGAR